LAKGDTDVSSNLTDTDTYSSGVNVQTSTVLSFPDIDVPGEDAQNQIITDIQCLDSSCGAIRHISPIQSRFLGLYITADNFQTFLLSIKAADRALWARKIINQLNSAAKDCLHLLPDRVNAIEKIWTGHHRLRPSFGLISTQFYTVYRASYYVSPSWEQIRDLCVISVSEDAFKMLVSISGLKPTHGKAKRPCGSEGRQNNLEEDISALRNSNAQQNLLAAISRTTGYVDNVDNANERNRSSNRKFEHGCSPRPFPRFRNGDAEIWELVNFIYKSHKRGDLEPDLGFLRVSKRQEHQIINHHTATKLDPDSLQVSEEGGILIRSEYRHHRLEESSNLSPLCLFVAREFTDPPSRGELIQIIKNTYENFDVYHTSRDSRILSPRTKREERPVWNLEGPYGVDVSCPSYGFTTWLQKWHNSVPLRQGTPCGPNDSGRMIFARNFFPWCDSRRNSVRPCEESRKKHINMIVQSQVRIWTSIALHRKQHGVDCCICCSDDLGSVHHHDNEEISQNHYLCILCAKSLDASINGQDESKMWFNKIVRAAILQAIKLPLRIIFKPANQRTNSIIISHSSTAQLETVEGNLSSSSKNVIKRRPHKRSLVENTRKSNTTEIESPTKRIKLEIKEEQME
jgi:hypothetical protein